MTHQQVAGAPASAQSQNSFAGDCAMFLSFYVSLASIPLALAQMGIGGESLEGDRAKPCYWHVATHFSWPWCIPG